MLVKTAAVIVAAGRGVRASGGAEHAVPKQYRRLDGEPVLTHALRAFAVHDDVDAVLAVINDDDRALYDAASACLTGSLLPAAIGGATRQESVRAGLEALTPATPERVLIHDAARPFVSAALIARVAAALDDHEAALPALPVAETLKRGDGGRVTSTVDRAGMWLAQTPQGFRFQTIRDAHASAAASEGTGFTDDASIAEWHGVDVAIVNGETTNAKLTTMEDFQLAERLLAAHGGAGEWRTGHGYDVHCFATGDHVVLCGVTVPHDSALHGHSDADVGLHALTDALLGAIGDGDIGTHFPPSDPKWRGAASEVFLRDAAARVRARGGRISNVDVTLICELPKIGPYRAAMQQSVAEILEIGRDRVSVKATTTEGLGYTGRREGIAAQASASVWLPDGA
ncbi:MAG: bifunctional 2-C-methyl-D-erythritol 4-phosphate cytidylyltransferase/2-C-methyl-D-erythritol 2,4-cyclodiphosphate synthase [Methyloligellaceae bacterium]